MKFIFNLHTKDNFGKYILFLDRDGVVIEDTGYPIEIKKLKIKTNTIKKIINFKKQNNINICGFITNQSGVSRKYFTENKFWDTHKYIIKCCKDFGLSIDFTCVNFFKEENYFRKPNNGMIETSIKYFNAKRSSCYLIGDKETDLLSAKKSRVKYIDINFFD